MHRVKYWLRWLAVLPGALLGGVLLTFPLHWTLYQTLNQFIEPYPELPERILSPLVVAVGFVWLGARIAPTRKVETAVILFGLWMVLLGVTLAMTLFVRKVGNLHLFLRGGGLASAGAFVGGAIGFFLARHEASKQSTQSRRAPLESKSRAQTSLV